MEIDVRDDQDRQRFEAVVDGQVVGAAHYRRTDDEITFYHTVVEPAVSGHGIGNVLVRTALDRARSAGLKVAPTCPFFAAFIRAHHDEYADLVVGRLQDEVTT